MTPVILELGGKNPVYIDESVQESLEIAVKRILWGKLTNAGQTCIAPDYIMCKAEIHDRFVEVVQKVVKEFYKSDSKNFDSFSRIINDRHFDRIQDLLSQTRGKVGMCVLNFKKLYF